MRSLSLRPLFETKAILDHGPGFYSEQIQKKIVSTFWILSTFRSNKKTLNRFMKFKNFLVYADNCEHRPQI